MKISELQKRDDFEDLAERVHHLIDDWENYDIMRSEFKDLLNNSENSLVVARKLDKWYTKNRPVK